MTTEEQRIAIGAACGWRVYLLPEDKAGDEDFTVLVRPDGEETDFGGFGEVELPYFLHRLPDYLNDLNAIHEAEKTLTYWPDYLFHLREIVGPFPDAHSEWDDNWWRDVVHATAAQRAEAFLRTLNLWTEEGSTK